MKTVYTILGTLTVFCYIVLMVEPVVTLIGYLVVPLMFCLTFLGLIQGKTTWIKVYSGVILLFISTVLIIEGASVELTYGNSITSFFNNSWYLLGKFVS